MTSSSEQEGDRTTQTKKGSARTNRPHDPQPGAAIKGKSKSGSPKQTVEGGVSQAGRGDRRQEVIKQRREERLRYAEKHRRQQLLTRIGIGILAVVLIGAAAYGIYNWNQDRNNNKFPDGTVTYDNLSRQHDETIPLQYDPTPPVGGNHNPVPQTCGYYSQPILNEHGTHSLEHGAVWITYSPDLPQDQIDVLKQLAEGQSYILVSPYDGLPSPVVASSWGHQLKLDSATDPRLDQFIRVFRNSAKYTPEFGAACSGTTEVAS
jgi:hypothetical protein